MKKFFLLITCSLFITSIAAREIFVEIKGSGFFPTSHLFKKIYHSAGMIGAELTVEGDCNFYGWFSVDYLRKSGLSLNGLSKTKVTYLPLGFGLKYLHPFCYGNLYAGLGAIAARIHTHDFSPNVAPYYNKWGWGGILKLGVLYDLSCSVLVDVFVNYAFSRASSNNTFNNLVIPHTVKVNGVIFGVGLGYRF